MNYFAHAFRFIGRPRFVTGTALPDWLSVVNRRLRFRPQRLDPAALHADQKISELMAGIKQHLEDDNRFHNCEAFSRCLVAVLQEVRPFLNGVGIPPVFLSHLLVEVLLDAQLVRTRQADVSRYYADLESVDPDWTEWATGEILGQSVSGLAHFIRLFCREKILFDYADSEPAAKAQPGHAAVAAAKSFRFLSGGRRSIATDCYCPCGRTPSGPGRMGIAVAE